MNTTAIVTEILVGGLEAEAWLSLLVLAVFGSSWIDLGAVDQWAALVTLLVIAGAYVLGVLVDRIADYLVVSPLDRLMPSKPVDKPASIERMRLTLLAKDDGVAKFLDYQRSRMRVARVTILNLALLLPVMVVFLIRQTDSSALVVVAAALVTCLALAVAVGVYRDIEFAYLCRLSDAFRIAKELSEPEVAAAICCRWRDPRFEFALVSTEDGARWTFPKGHRKSRETLPQAAAREAEEEAGIKGRVDGNRLLEYRYPPTRAGQTDDDSVVAFLLKPTKTGLPRESRELAWCGLEEARAKVAEDREPIYREELDRALLAAARALDVVGDDLKREQLLQRLTARLRHGRTPSRVG
jgi:8-oxo-dGTP pyrophosphatase MutT (NUDIX family)